MINRKIASIAGASCAFALMTVITPAHAGGHDPAYQPTMSCADLMNAQLDRASVVSADIVAGEPDRCRVEIVKLGKADAPITMWYELPQENWTGRFLGTGGAAYVGGFPDFEGIVYPGFVVGATDVGRTTAEWPAAFVVADFATDADGNENWVGIENFAHRGIHEMTVTGKELSEVFYGQAVENAYFDGCSTGGRQGIMEAQRYPTDYNGIMSGAPAINLAKFHIAMMWPQSAMLQSNHIVDQCKLSFATQSAVAACDGADGLMDGIIGNYDACTFDAQSLVGDTAECGAFSALDAELVNSFWQGATRENGDFMWHGVRMGSDLSALAASDGDPLVGQPDPIAHEWIQRLVLQNPDWDWTKMTAAEYEQHFDQSVARFNDVIGTDNPDLSAFQENGGKLLVWHGEADGVIAAGGSIEYFNKVNAFAAQAGTQQDFMRLFLAPGVGHCFGGNGAMPSGMLDLVVDWVENDNAPDTILAQSPGGEGVAPFERPLCQYPAYAKYDGAGDPSDASSFSCVSE